MPAAADGTPSERRIAELEARLHEAEETLDAIRSGQVDAVIVDAQNRQQVYTLESADHPYRVLIEQMQEGAVTVSAEGTILYCNRRFAAMLSTPLERVIGGSLFRFVPAVQHARLNALLAASSTGGGKGEFELLNGGDATLPAYLSFIDLPHEHERILCGVVTDLAQQKQAELQRRSAEENLQIALDAAGLAHWSVDFATYTVHRSPRLDAILGAEPRQSWSREAFMSLVLAEDRGTVDACLLGAADGDGVEFECRIERLNDGAVRWVRINGRTYYEGGKPVRMAGVLADITERRQLEDQLRQAQKMEAVGQLTGGLAHDFNNLLAVIVTSLELAQHRVTDPMLARQLDHARQAADRGAMLTRQLLAFSRRQSLQPRAVCVNELFAGLELLVQRTVGEHIRLRFVRGEDLWHCKVDPHQLESALLNLVINARDAMPKGGNLRIETANIVVSEADAAAIPDAVPGRYVRVSVIDSGAGMAPAVRARVFEPFFTTKEIGKGSGLGLSMVYGFVRQSNGYVVLESDIGRGTSVHLYLPWAEGTGAENAQSSHEHRHSTDAATILVVEDDPHVRPVVVDLVTGLGHRALEANNGRDALTVLDQRPEIDLVFTDIVMPEGMSGIELAREARRRRPGIAILLTTGFTSQSLAQEQESDKEFRIIHKPYRHEELADAIDGALAEVRETV